MHHRPLGELCPDAVVVWHDDAARCDRCGTVVERTDLASPWRHNLDAAGVVTLPRGDYDVVTTDT